MGVTPTHDTAIQQPIELQKAVWEVQQEAITQGFIGFKVMVPFKVNLWSDNYTVFPIESFFNTHDTKRKNDGSYNRISENFEQGKYQTTEYGLEARIDERDAAIYSNYFDYQLHLSTILMNAILRRAEEIIAAKYFPGAFTPVGLTTPWSNVAADPFADLETGKRFLRDDKGVNPNSVTLVLNWENLQNLMLVTKVIDAVKNMFSEVDKTGTVEIRHLEAYLKTPILVAGAQANTEPKGQDAALGDIWDKNHAMLALLANPGDDITKPSAGRTFEWNEGQAQTIIVEEYEEERTRGRVLRVRHDVDYKFLASLDDALAVKSKVSEEVVYVMDNVNP